MKTRPFYIKLIIPAILIPLFGLHSARPAFSQKEAASKPKVKLTILFVAEKVACRYDGYVNYDSTSDEPSKSKCKPIKYEENDIKNLKAKAKAKIQTEPVPPSEIKLEEDLFKKIRTYSTTAKASADSRRAIILIFEWDTPQTGKVILERVSNCKGIPGMTFDLPPRIIPEFKLELGPSQPRDPGGA